MKDDSAIFSLLLREKITRKLFDSSWTVDRSFFCEMDQIKMSLKSSNKYLTCCVASLTGGLLRCQGPGCLGELNADGQDADHDPASGRGISGRSWGRLLTPSPRREHVTLEKSASRFASVSQSPNA